MTALACFRIMLDPGHVATGGDALAALVGKVAGAFLETRWRWPRRYGEIAPYAFLLADPQVERLPPEELIALSQELQLKLFGTGGAGKISLGMLEGEQDAVTQFAAVDPAILRQILAHGGVIDGIAGRISEVTPEGIRVVSPDHEAGPMVPVSSTRRQAPQPARGFESAYRAIWFSPRQAVVGNGLVARRAGARLFFSALDGPAEMPGAAATEFDLTCLEASLEALAVSQGLIFLPINFSSTIQPATRERYLDALETLPQHERARLAVTVYDVPRSPTFTAIAQLKAFLNPYFSIVDLQTSDPDFQIDALQMEIVKSVTLSLPDTDEPSRIAMATRFMANREAYQRRRIWPAITNVRTRKELASCVRLRAPFLSGHAVCDYLSAPAEPQQYASDRLPVRERSFPFPQQRFA